jgi:hypothetical protein
MSLIPRYLVSNRTLLITKELGLTTEYAHVYQKNLSVYKGIDNALDFQILNQDQKSVSLAGQTPVFVAFDENDNLIIEHHGVIVNSNKGLFRFTVTENDLINIKQQYITYNIFLKDSSNTKTLTYANSHYEATGTIFISSRTFPGPRATYIISQFQSTGVDSEVFVSESVTAEPALNGNEALHTAVIYTENFVGTVTLQATLENQITGTTKWADVDSIAFDGTESEPVPVNFNGVYSFLRFRTDADPSDKITQILVRN